MKERGILFSAPMVRALLDGTKTVTRRLVKAASGRQSAWLTPALLNSSPRAEMGHVDGALGAQFEHPKGGPLGWVRCPYGNAGDRLWVRETFCEGYPGTADRYLYRATYEGGCEHKWTPGIHMPRTASRITLRVVDVRVERLHAITDTDIEREGVVLTGPASALVQRVGGVSAARERFVGLWEEINGKRAPWSTNPWVWRVAFEVVPRG